MTTRRRKYQKSALKVRRPKSRSNLQNTTQAAAVIPAAATVTGALIAVAVVIAMIHHLPHHPIAKMSDQKPQGSKSRLLHIPLIRKHSVPRRRLQNHPHRKTNMMWHPVRRTLLQRHPHPHPHPHPLPLPPLSKRRNLFTRVKPNQAMTIATIKCATGSSSRNRKNSLKHKQAQ